MPYKQNILQLISNFYVYSFSGYELKYEFSILASIIGLIIGITIPFLSNIIPIQRSLSKTLRDGLSLYRNYNN